MARCELRIANIVFVGQGPFKRPFSQDDFERIIDRGKLRWDVLNSECNPILQTRIPKHELTVYGKPKHACISFWSGGKVIITGVISRKEAEKYYALALQDLRKLGLLKGRRS